MDKSRTKQDISNNVTFLVSALWHGFYPGYFIAFFNWSFVSIVAKSTYKAGLNYPSKIYNNIFFKSIKAFYFLYILNYFGIMFYFLHFDLCF